jgi:hypothetical protein
MGEGSGGCTAFGCVGAVTGMAAGAASWALADAARRSCASYPVHGWRGLHPAALELPAAMAAGTLTAALAVGLTRVLLRRHAWPTRRSVMVTAVVVLVALALLTWAHFAWWGTAPGLVGETPESGRCTRDGVPGWWPGWVPA